MKADIRRDAPWPYKDITPVVNTQTDAAIVRKVNQHWPIMTIRG